MITHSVMAEQAILVGVLYQADLLFEVTGLLQPAMFYRPAHQYIFAAMLECQKVNEPVNVVTLSEMMNDLGTLEPAGGRVYLMALATEFVDGFLPAPEPMRYWAKKIREYAAQRRLNQACEEIVMDGLGLQEAQAKMQEVADLLEPPQTSNVQMALDSAFERIEQKLSGSGVTGLSTGFRRLDSMINGLEPNRLITLGARSGNGKTAFSLNIASTMVFTHKRPVLFFSLEMKADELLERLIRLLSGSTFDRLKLQEAKDQIARSKSLLIIEDGVDFTISDIQAITQRHQSRNPDLGLVILDYIGKVKPSGDSKKYQSKAYEVEGTTWGLKTIAKTRNLPVLALCQMNRGIESRGDKTKPLLSDLKDSGAIEQDSDIVMFLTSDEDSRTSPILTIAKQRNGPMGDIPMFFQGAICKFTEAPSGTY